MHASLWGFPDTETYLWLFKSPQAEFTIWEADPAGRQWDPFGNNDDEVDSWNADIRSDETQQGWTAVYDEEFHMDPLVWNPAEYYFEVKVEDQLCTSSKIVVPPE